jgi:hypothetical protein
MTWLKSWGAEEWREGAVILECDLSVLNEGDYRSRRFGRSEGML